MFTKAKQLRGKHDTISMAFLSLKQKIDSDPDFVWAAAPALSQPMQANFTSLQDVLAASPFWTLWSMHPQWPIEAKKRFTVDEMRASLGRLSNIQSALDSLEASVNVILRMQAARI